MSKALPKTFFNLDAVELAKKLLGKILCVKYRMVWLYARIIETEAYYIHDKASHASLGFTLKRKALFMPAGTIYMYHSRGGPSLNVSCLGEGNAVLIKSGIPCREVFTSEKDFAKMVKTMQVLNPAKNSVLPRPWQKLCSGQTLLCRSLGLVVSDWDQKQFDQNLFYIAADGYKPKKIINTKRLGIPLGRDEHLPYRFVDFANIDYCTNKKRVVS
ncbi:MAG: DNA-3-methyladenine glycosylase [Gammaproteobacteria bacterium]|nr:DNA-3-methyladenine glycosylase [Gammaproteobacteria bacterium]